MPVIKQINSSEDFAHLLQTEEALLLLQLARSSSLDSSFWLKSWIAENNYSGLELTANAHPFCWQWINEILNAEDPGQLPATALVWLKNGEVAELFTDPHPADASLLCQKNARHFSSNIKGDSLLVDAAAVIAPDLLEILCCPETHQKLSVANNEIIAKLNEAQSNRQLKNRTGQIVREPLTGGLLRADGRYLYPLRGTIPVLLIAESIPVA